VLFRSSSLGNTRSTTRHDHHAVTRRVSRDVAPEPPLCGTFRTGSKSQHLAWCARGRNTATCASPVTTCWRSAGGGVCQSAISPPGSGQLLPASLRSVRHARARLPRRFRAGWHNCDTASTAKAEPSCPAGWACTMPSCESAPAALGRPRSRHSAGRRGLNCDRRRTECRSSR
jgi:hypothetical protein